MARKSFSGGPLLSALAVLLVLAGGVVFWMWQSNHNSAAEAAAPKTAPALPTGPLQLLRIGVTETRYLSLGDRNKADQLHGVVVLVVAKNPKGMEGGSGLLVERKQVRCTPQRVFDHAAAYYDTEGKLVAARSFIPPRHGRQVAPEELELVGAICGVQPVSPIVLDGFRAAQRESQYIPEGYEKLVETRLDDPHAWAWMCAEAARRGWRKQAAQDCARAVRLNPNSNQVRLDRAYLSMVVGDAATAQAEFDAVVAREPQNPRALFGRGLALAMRGDEAGGRADRRKALQIDPNVLRWVEGTYRFTVGTGWRTA